MQKERVKSNKKCNLIRHINTLLAAALAAAMMAVSPMSVNAQAVVMPDGTTFDAAFYAAAYPDVAAALGTSADALYNHYVQHGKAEGRFPSPCAAESAKEVKKPVPAQVVTEADRIIEQTNAERAKYGLPPLKKCPYLTKDAAKRAEECATLFEHQRPNGSMWYTIDPAHMFGENIAETPNNDAVDMWMHSTTGHREIILDPRYKSIGVGVYKNEYVQEFGY